VFSVTEQKDCSTSIKFEGKAACPKTIALQKYMDAIAPFLGVIFIILGTIMVFFGSRFILYVFSGLVGLLIAGLIFLFTYNKILDDFSATKGAIIGTLFVSALFGGLFSFLAFKFMKNWAIAVIAAWGGIAVFVPLSKVAGLHGTAASLGVAVVGAGLGFYIGKKFNVYVRSIGTAVIGSFLFTRGAGSIIGGYPNETQIATNAAGGKFTYDPAILGYAACMIVLAIGGSVFQIRQNGDVPTDDEMFANEDEAKKCC
jgi:hypothetical protein